MQQYHFHFYLRSLRISACGPVPFPSLKAAHEHCLNLIARTLACLHVPTTGWVLMISDEEGADLLHIIVPARSPALSDQVFVVA